MSDDDFNMSMRKFLKRVGVTSQQEIETAIRKARDEGRLTAESVTARVVLTIDEIGLTHTVDGEISTSEAE